MSEPNMIGYITITGSAEVIPGPPVDDGSKETD